MPYPSAGGKSTPGAPGVGVASSTVTYQLSGRGDVVPSGNWADAVPVPAKGQYLWSRTVTSFTNGMTTTAYSAAYSGSDGSPGTPGSPGDDGDQGQPGSPGKDGNGLSSSTITYRVADNADAPPASGWSSSMPAVAKGKYLWTRTATSYTDGSSTTAYSLGYVALDGAPGTPGADGKGVSSAVVTYQAAASGIVPPTGSWIATVPAVAKGQFLWTRVAMTMTDTSTVTYYSVAYQGADGSPGTPGTNGTNGISYTPQPPTARTVTVATAYQHTDTTKPYKVMVNARSTQTVTVAGLVSDKVELRVGPTAASVAAGGSGGFSVGLWESGITGIALMVGAAVLDGGQISGDVPAGWYFSVNRLTGTNATIVSCFTQSLTP